MRARGQGPSEAPTRRTLPSPVPLHSVLDHSLDREVRLRFRRRISDPFARGTLGANPNHRTQQLLPMVPRLAPQRIVRTVQTKRRMQFELRAQPTLGICSLRFPPLPRDLCVSNVTAISPNVGVQREVSCIGERFSSHSPPRSSSLYTTFVSCSILFSNDGREVCRSRSSSACPTAFRKRPLYCRAHLIIAYIANGIPIKTASKAAVARKSCAAKAGSPVLSRSRGCEPVIPICIR